jgi:hypothetical protein
MGKGEKKHLLLEMQGWEMSSSFSFLRQGFSVLPRQI